MAARTVSEKGEPLSDASMQQSIVQQAEAVIASESDGTREEPTIQMVDLLDSETEHDDVPPPAYGDHYGEIHNEKNGFGTSAEVTDDGRVNIHINQVNRRLSQIFTPALKQQMQNVEDSRSAPPPYIPPALGGEEGTPPPPPLNVVIQVVGSRGDVQPFVALGKVLKETYGHRVRLATHPVFKQFVQENDLEFFSIGGDPSQLMAFMVKNPGLVPGFRSIVSGDVAQRRRDVAEYIQGCWRSCYQTGDGMGLGATATDSSEPTTRPFVADCIIANPPSFAHVHCAERLGIPLHIMFTMPYSPTQAFPHPLANVKSSNADAQLANYISYTMIELLSWQGLGEIINRFRAKCLGLDPISTMQAPGMLQRLKVPHTYCWSPALIPKPKDWGPHISISGFYFLNLASNFTPSPDLEAFLKAGPPPVYIGFGSIVLDDPNAMTELIFEAVRKSRQRVLLSKGWGGMGADEMNVPEGVFMLGNVPHDWLFKQVSCVVHHGGAGTTAAGITAGRPTVIVPFFGDQPFWGAMIARAGAGPTPIYHKQLTADKLVDAIDFCLQPQTLKRATDLANKIGKERGTDMGAVSFHQYLEPDRLRCIVAPNRPATWRIKHTQFRLSAFAACTLANAKLLEFQDLKLFRPQEYETDEGPVDPLSGGTLAVLGAFGGMAKGLADIPTETYKAMQMPFKSNRQQSRTSLSTVTDNDDASTTRERSTAPTSPGQSQLSLDGQESVSHLRKPSYASSLRSPSSNMESSSMSDTLQDQLSPRQESVNGNRVRSRDSSDYGNEDMLRHKGAHASKGLGKFVKVCVQSPMDVSVSMTRGFHNLPKHWGDETVRPQEKVTNFASGAKAAGKEFGLGLYDGISGMVTQPWQGARKEGTSGFFKGVGKGLGGFFAKPCAGVMGVPGYLMKGVQKEVQKAFGTSVHNYIITSRTAQGYEEWLQSSEEEREDVIARWKMLQKYMKKKRLPEDMVQDVLDAQRKLHLNGGQAVQARNSFDPSVRSVSMDAQNGHSEVIGPVRNRSWDLNSHETLQVPTPRMLSADVSENANMIQTVQGASPHLQREQPDAENHERDQEILRQAMAASEAEAQRQESEYLDYEEQLKQVMAKSLREQRQNRSNNEWESRPGVNTRDNERFEFPAGPFETRTEDTSASPGPSTAAQQLPPYDPGHLAGTTQREFEEQQQNQPSEKTAQEKTEEEIVLQYIKKQSLLEQQHRDKGKGRAAVTNDQEHEELQRVLKLSMREHEKNELYENGEASST